VETAARHGIDISMQRARQLTPDDFDRFDLIFAMDRSNEATMRARAPSYAA
jgi:protein-tyrosine phosphatase